MKNVIVVIKITMKQCETCKYHTYRKIKKEYHEGCFLLSQWFMKPHDCDTYEQGELNQGRKEFFKKFDRLYEND